MNRTTRLLAILLPAALALSGCEEQIPVVIPQAGATPPRSTEREAEIEILPVIQEESAEVVGPQETRQPSYLEALVQQTVDAIVEPGMGEYEMAKGAFDYLIENTTLIDPVGLDLWRIRGDYEEPLSYVENRSLSVLQFHLGKCEDYAAALTVILRGMGLEAEYVPGLTYSTQGELVDHAWTVARVDGVWYHLDCQLEQNISRHGSIRYKYFMRGDATMAGSHRWGQNLIQTGLLSAYQNEEIAQNHIPPACPQDHPTPERNSFTPVSPPDIDAITAAVEAEFREYELANGALEPLEINTLPPVFGLEGYGPQD